MENNSNHAENSLTSDFQFFNYKIDKFIFKMKPQVKNIFINTTEMDNWKFGVKIHNPKYFKKNQVFISGLDFNMIYVDPKNTDIKKEQQDFDISLQTAISGCFKEIGNRFTKEQILDLAKYQTAAILFPFLRSAITSYFALAGFGSFVMPLMNFVEIAKEQKDLSIEEVDEENIS